jgi:CRISPR-associated protein Cmr4
MSTQTQKGATIPFVLYLYAETPVHVGSGSSLGVVDLPIQRERATGLPILPATGLRGALREQLLAVADAAAKEKQVLAWFGSVEGAGGVTLDDAKLLLFPLRALSTGWVWATSPMLLDRLRRDLQTAEGDEGLPPTVKAVPPGGARMAAKDAKGKLLIEEQAYDLAYDETLVAWIKRLADALPDSPAYTAFRDRLTAQVVLLNDGDLCELTQIATEVATRVRIDGETHTVAQGALWTEEHVPAESLFWCGGQIADHARKDPDSAAREVIRQTAGDQSTGLSNAVKALARLRIGGNQGVGRGRVALRLWTKGVGGGAQ